MLTLASSGWFLLLLFLFFSFSIGLLQREKPAGMEEYLFAGKGLSPWRRSVAFAASGVSALWLLAMSAAGASCGLEAAGGFALGLLAALLLAGLWLLPRYRRAGADTAPEFLGQRFGRRMRTASALLLTASTLASAAFSLSMLARLAEALHLADPMLYALGVPRPWSFSAVLIVLGVVVAGYVLPAGLAGTTMNQLVQFAVLLAGLVPAVYGGIASLGGWSGFAAALPAALAKAAPGPHAVWLPAFAGLVLGAAFWSVDMRPVQRAIRGNDKAGAHTPVWTAALLWLVPALLASVSGAVALSLPTPQSSTSVREEGGVIYHEVTVVPREIAAGQGAVPAQMNPATHAPQQKANGRTALDFALALPGLMGRTLPSNLMVLGVAALFAACMCGLGASLSALTALVTCDLVLPWSKAAAAAEPGTKLKLTRWIAAAAAYLVAALAWLAGRADLLAGSTPLYLLLALTALGAVPVFAAVLAAVSFTGVSAMGAVGGLMAGELAALAHYGLTLPSDAAPGLAGGWFGCVFRYENGFAQSLATAAIALVVTLTGALWPCLGARPEETGKPAQAKPFSKR